eukprot:4764439-Pyramimonas_sp.AAC.1
MTPPLRSALILGSPLRPRGRLGRLLRRPEEDKRLHDDSLPVVHADLLDRRCATPFTSARSAPWAVPEAPPVGSADPRNPRGPSNIYVCAITAPKQCFHLGIPTPV